MIYDIAIIGAGCAGLSLAYQILKNKKINKKIIILDKKPEFKKWEWSTEVQIMNKIVNFKKKLYKGVFEETRSYF